MRQSMNNRNVCGLLCCKVLYVVLSYKWKWGLKHTNQGGAGRGTLAGSGDSSAIRWQLGIITLSTFR